MTRATLFPSWKEIVRYGPDGPEHQPLLKTDTFRAVLVGLEAGQRIAPHPSTAGPIIFLKGADGCLSMMSASRSNRVPPL